MSPLDRRRANGRAFSEQAITLGGLFSAFNAVKSVFQFKIFERAQPALQEFSRAYLFSGKPKASGSINTARSKNWLQPDLQAEGTHSVFRRDATTRRVTHYATYRPQTNPFDPKPWELIKRYDGMGKGHRNKFFKQLVDTPHIHDPYYPGEVRSAWIDEIPKQPN